jgi:uncharacterized membrane protein
MFWRRFMLHIGFSFSGEEEIPFDFYEGFVRFLECDLSSVCSFFCMFFLLYVLSWLDHGGWIIAAEIMVWPIAIYLSGVDMFQRRPHTVAHL